MRLIQKQNPKRCPNERFAYALKTQSEFTISVTDPLYASQKPEDLVLRARHHSNPLRCVSVHWDYEVERMDGGSPRA